MPGPIHKTLTIADITVAQALALAAEFWASRGMTLEHASSKSLYLRMNGAGRIGSFCESRPGLALSVIAEAHDCDTACSLEFQHTADGDSPEPTIASQDLDAEMAAFARFAYVWAIDRTRTLRTSWISNPCGTSPTSPHIPADVLQPAAAQPGDAPHAADDLLPRIEAAIGARLEWTAPDRLCNTNLGVQIICLTSSPNASVRGSCRYHFALTDEHLAVLDSTPDSAVVFFCADTRRAFLSLRPEFMIWLADFERTLALPHPTAREPIMHRHFLLIDSWTSAELVPPARAQGRDILANLIPQRSTRESRDRSAAGALRPGHTPSGSNT